MSRPERYRTEVGRLSIDVILKLGALFGDLAQLREGKNLVTAAIRQNRSVPIHEFVKSAKIPDHLDAGSNEQMIRVTENNLRLQLAQLTWTHRFDAGLCPHRDERRCFNGAVRSCQPPPPCF